MVVEAQERQRVVDFSPMARENRIEVLKQNLADSRRLITNLEAERARLLMRLSQIPDSISTVREWMAGVTQELETLEGPGLNGHSTSDPIPSLASVDKS